MSFRRRLTHTGLYASLFLAVLASPLARAGAPGPRLAKATLHTEPDAGDKEKPDIRIRRALPKRAVDMHHRVRRGDSLWKIARKYGVKVKTLVRLNGKKKTRILRPGQSLLIKIRNPKTLQRFRPYLRDWGRLEKGEGYVIKRPGRAYGRPWAIALILAGIDEVHGRFDDSSRLVIGDISGPGGGYLPKHLSHKTGRDVDIGYFEAGNTPLTHFRRVDGKTIEIEKNWALLESFLRSGQCEYVFMEHKLQKLFYEYAKSLGYPESELEKIFQYPRSRRTRVGIIRHAKGHADHIHVRFSCPPGDKLCR